MFKNEFIRKSTCLLLVSAILAVTGCGGHAANPVDRYMPGDEKRSCSSLLAEMGIIDGEIVAKGRKVSERDTWNVLEFAAGWFLIVPFFFMNAKGSYEVEIDALRARKTMLKTYFAENGCSVANPSLKAH